MELESSARLPDSRKFGEAMLAGEPDLKEKREADGGSMAMSVLPSKNHLTFLVLEPELLLDLLARKADGAAVLGPVQGLGDVMGAVLLNEVEQLLSAAVLLQHFQDICKSWARKKRFQIRSLLMHFDPINPLPPPPPFLSSFLTASL